MESSKYPIPTGLNLANIVMQLAAAAAILWGGSLATQWWQVGLLSCGFAIVGNSIYAIVHEAEHGLLHPDHRVNELLGAGMALLFPAPYHLIRQGHLGHHRRTQLRHRRHGSAFRAFRRVGQAARSGAP